MIDRLASQVREEIDVKTMAATPQPTVVAVQRGLIILDLVARAPDGLGTREISRKLGYGSGTTQKILNTLRSHGWIAKRSDTGRYVLGLGAIAFAYLANSHSNVITLARPFLERLVRETDEAAYLAIRQEEACVYVDKVLGDEEIRMDAPLGITRPLNCTAVGKALLAYAEGQDRTALRALAGSFEARTENSITDVDVLFDELVQVRSTGHALDIRECNASGACIAAAVRDGDGVPVAAITVTGPAERLVAKREEIARLVREVAEEFSRSLSGVAV